MTMRNPNTNAPRIVSLMAAAATRSGPSGTRMPAGFLPSAWNGRPGEQNEADRSYKRSNDQRTACSVARHESAGPSGKKEHHKNQRQDRSARCSCGVSLDLNQVQWEQEKKDSDRSV